MTDLLICPKCSLQPPQAEQGDRCPLDGAVLVMRRHWETRANDPLLGRVLGGKYAVVGFVAEGGFGSVYRAIQEPVGRLVAVKVLAENQQRNEDLRQRFFREARVVARLSHPCCVVLHDYGEEPDGRLYMVFELVDGVSLVDVLRSDGPLAPRRAASLIRGVLGALKEAHGLGLVHRDLKPSNIMVVRGSFGEEEVKVLDFGIAKLTGEEGPKDQLRTRQGLVLGTPHYMAPEQARGEQVDARSDLYAVGVLLYECLVGRPPFDGGSDIAVLMAQIQQPIPRIPPHLNVPAALVAFVEKSMQKKAAERFQSAEEMAAALVRTVEISAAWPVMPSEGPSTEPSPTEVLQQAPKVPSGQRGAAEPPRATPVRVAEARPTPTPVKAEPARATHEPRRPSKGAPALEETSAEMPVLAMALQETPPYGSAQTSVPQRPAGAEPAVDDTPAVHEPAEAEFASPDMTEQVDPRGLPPVQTSPAMQARRSGAHGASGAPSTGKSGSTPAATGKSGSTPAATGKSGSTQAAPAEPTGAAPTGRPTATGKSGPHAAAPHSGQLQGERISVQVDAVAAPQRRSKFVAAAVVLAALVAAGAWWISGRDDRHAASQPDDQSPVIVPVTIGPAEPSAPVEAIDDTPAPLPKEPFARASELARRNEIEAAELALLDAFRLSDEPAQIELARKVRADALFRDVMARPAVQAALSEAEKLAPH